MPIIYGQYTKQLQLLPLTLGADGSASVDVRYGFVDEGGQITGATCRTLQIEAGDVSLVLDAIPDAGLTRREDLSLAVYRLLVARGLVEPGELT